MKKGEKRKKGIGIQAKVLGALIPSVILIVSIIIFFFYKNTATLVAAKSETILETSTESIVSEVSSWTNAILSVLNSERDALEYFSLTPSREQDYIKHTANKYDAFPDGIYIAEHDGTLTHASFIPDENYSFFDKGFYTAGKNSEKFIFSDAYLDANTKAFVVSASGILKDKFGKSRGVAVADISLAAISDIVSPITIEETGAAFLVDGKTNLIIGSKEASELGVSLNQSANEMHQYIYTKIASGSSGLSTYTGRNGEKLYISIHSIPNTEWLAVSFVPMAEVMKDLNSMIRFLVTFTVVALFILAITITLLIKKTVVQPVLKIDSVAQKIADGELNQSIEYSSSDEFGKLAVNFNKTVSKLRDYVIYIDEISKVLNEIADGELDFSLVQEYTGDFAKIKHALERISDSLNQTLGDIDQSANQVASGADQVASGAQALSQGATEQASSVEELAATINEISDKVAKNADHAKQAREKTLDVIEEIGISNQRMQNMLSAMTDISTKSSEIGKIIKTIEDIAFQTNILALNAAVEAARAGTAGKGFAVVADEVRNLANKSSEASKNTAELIESSLSAVDNGTKIADETAASLVSVVKGIENVNLTIEGISSASEEQAISINQVTLGMDQISSVVQTNSATSEESAAASQELSGQAQMLKELVGRFHLKQTK